MKTFNLGALRAGKFSPRLPFALLPPTTGRAQPVGCRGVTWVPRIPAPSHPSFAERLLYGSLRSVITQRACPSISH